MQPFWLFRSSFPRCYLATRAALPLRPFHSLPFLVTVILAVIRPIWLLFGRCFSWPLQPLILIIGWPPLLSMLLFVQLSLFIPAALWSLWPLLGHFGRSLFDRHRYSFFSSPSSLRSFAYSITVFVCVSISRTMLPRINVASSHTVLLPHLIPRFRLAYCDRHLSHIVDSISHTLSSPLSHISYLRCRASFFDLFSKGGQR